jgi:hypothetical protein
MRKLVNNAALVKPVQKVSSLYPEGEAYKKPAPQPPKK